MARDYRDLNIYVREDLYETKQHGDADYPFALYYVDTVFMNLNLVHWHWHEELEYVYVTGGTACFYADDSCHILSAGQCLLINQNVLHRVMPYKDCSCTYYSVVFHPSIFLDLNNPITVEHFLKPITTHPKIKYYALTSVSEEQMHIKRLLQKIIHINIKRQIGYEIETKGVLCQLWTLALRGALEKDNKIESTGKYSQEYLDEERIKTGLSYISSHYAEQITLEDIAENIHISKSECCRCFKRKLHITPFECVIKYRVYAAALLICQPVIQHSISDIALQCGFNSSSYFNKMFRKYFLCTPSQFRKKADGNYHTISNLLVSQLTSYDVSILNTLIEKSQKPEL